MNRHIPWIIHSIIHDYIEIAIDEALNDRTQHEPQLVANLIYFITEAVNNKIRAILKDLNVDISAGGVFVHQQPQVSSSKFPKSKPKAVEIGDLLLLVRYVDTKKRVNRWALLLQAKKSAMPHVILDNPNQHYLYSYWPEFKYSRSTPKLYGKIRKVTGPNLYDGTKYLIIGTSDRLIDVPGYRFWRCRCNSCEDVWAVIPTKLDNTGRRCFHNELYDLIFGEAGRSFIYQPTNNTINWDQVITDLIEITAKRASVYMKRSAGGEGKRGQGVFFCLGNISNMLDGTIETGIDSDYPPLDGPPKISDEPEPDDNEGGGMSIVEFLIKEME